MSIFFRYEVETSQNYTKCGEMFKKLWEKVMMKNSNSFMGEEMRKVLIYVTLSSYRSSTVVE